MMTNPSIDGNSTEKIAITFRRCHVQTKSSEQTRRSIYCHSGREVADVSRGIWTHVSSCRHRSPDSVTVPYHNKYGSNFLRKQRVLLGSTVIDFFSSINMGRRTKNNPSSVQILIRTKGDHFAFEFHPYSVSRPQ